MTLDVSPTRPIKVPMFVLGLCLVAGASWGGAYVALRGEIAGLASQQARDKLQTAADIAAVKTAIEGRLGEGKAAYDEFRVDVQTRLGTLEKSDLTQAGDLKRMQQDQSSLAGKMDALGSTMEEVRRTLAVLVSKIENIGSASSAQLPGDPPRGRRR